MKCFWIYLYIYICTHIYSVCVYICRISTQILQSFIGSSTSVSRTPGFKVLSCWAKVTAEDKGLAWCTSPCEGPSLLDSGNLQRTAYCMDQSHSSCHRSWHILDHRYHTRHRACTGWLHSSAEAPRARGCPLAGRPGRRPGMTRSSNFYGLDIHTCLSRRTGRK